MRSCAISSASMVGTPSSANIRPTSDFPVAIPPVNPIFSIEGLFHHRDTEARRKNIKKLLETILQCKVSTTCILRPPSSYELKNLVLTEKDAAPRGQPTTATAQGKVGVSRRLHSEPLHTRSMSDVGIYPNCRDK